jgi:hypothetical protein
MPGSTFSISRHAGSCLYDLLRIRAAARRVVPVAAPLPMPVADELRAG